MNANGEAVIFYGLDAYKLVETTSADVVLRTVDNISGDFLTKAAADLLYFPIGGTVDLSGTTLTGAVPLKFEGATDNAYETSLAITDPTADRVITVQDKSGIIALKNDESFSGTTNFESAKATDLIYIQRTNPADGFSFSITLFINTSDNITPGYSSGDFVVLGDTGDGAGRLVLNAGSGGILAKKSLTVNGDVTANASTSKIGYGTGAGGTVTQATSKSTGVTLNTPTGKIVMNNAALAAGTLIGFILTNNQITTSSIVLVNATGGAVSPWEYRVETARTSAGGSCAIRVTNLTVVSLSEALELTFAIINTAES
jgi:hypothetical protein